MRTDSQNHMKIIEYFKKAISDCREFNKIQKEFKRMLPKTYRVPLVIKQIELLKYLNEIGINDINDFKQKQIHESLITKQQNS